MTYILMTLFYPFLFLGDLIARLILKPDNLNSRSMASYVGFIIACLLLTVSVLGIGAILIGYFLANYFHSAIR